MTRKNTQLLQRQNLADAVVSRIQQQLSRGDFQPGEKLPSEPELMEQFGVGRSTIREAIRILANSGQLSVRQGSGTFVEVRHGIAEPLTQRLRRADFRDLDEVRQLLELKTAEKAALHRTTREIEKMKDLLRRRSVAAQAGDLEEAAQTDIQFHITIAEASRNPILADLYRTFAEQIRRQFREIYEDTGSFISTQRLHESLLQSIIDQDPKKAMLWAGRIPAPSFDGE